MIKTINIEYFKGFDSISIEDCGKINAFIGKNNSGKSSILHAIDLAGLALNAISLGNFQFKLKIEDLFPDVEKFSINFVFQNYPGLRVSLQKQGGGLRTVIFPKEYSQQKFKSFLISPGSLATIKAQQIVSPINIRERVKYGNWGNLHGLDILFALKYYATRNIDEFSKADYYDVLEEVTKYFPDIENLESDRTERDIATLTYTEYNKKLDIVYSGIGLKNFIDILVKMKMSKANILLLDEPEAGLHPDLQRRFLDYLQQYVENNDNVQIFMATHSPIILNYVDSIKYYRIKNEKSIRSVIDVSENAIHTLLSEMGIRPSDVFNHDICLLVEGASEVIFFEHIIHKIYKNNFEGVSVAVVQYGGAAAEGIISGNIHVENIIPAQKYTYWIRDKDAALSSKCDTRATKFKNALEKVGLDCHIWDKREIEYYYPEKLLIAAQENKEKEKIIVDILNGDQSKKFREAAKEKKVCVPSGKTFRKLLREHLCCKDDLCPEIQNIINQLIDWKNEILGEM